MAVLVSRGEMGGTEEMLHRGRRERKGTEETKVLYLIDVLYMWVPDTCLLISLLLYLQVRQEREA